MLDKANRLKARLGPHEERPKGMHQRTYERLQQQIDELEMQSLGIMVSRFE